MRPDYTVTNTARNLSAWVEAGGLYFDNEGIPIHLWRKTK